MKTAIIRRKVIRNTYPNLLNPVRGKVVMMTDEDYLQVPEAYCSTFACGRELSLIEKLAGDRCSKHMQTEPLKIDVLKYANY